MSSTAESARISRLLDSCRRVARRALPASEVDDACQQAVTQLLLREQVSGDLRDRMANPVVAAAYVRVSTLRYAGDFYRRRSRRRTLSNVGDWDGGRDAKAEDPDFGPPEGELLEAVARIEITDAARVAATALIEGLSAAAVGRRYGLPPRQALRLLQRGIREIAAVLNQLLAVD